jgi:lactoylglutathione lyase
MTAASVSELRLVITVDDLDEALALYRDALGLPQLAEFPGPGRVVLLDAGRATVELTDPTHADHIDEVEVGQRVASHLRVAFRVDDVDAATADATLARAGLLAGPTVTPWGSRNARLRAPDGLQLTLFAESDGTSDLVQS